MNNKRVFPTIVSYYCEEEYNRVARLIVKSYKSNVYPILFRFRLWDDEHIKKYLGCKTTEEIYKDAMRENKERMLFLEQEADFNEEDFWKIIRDETSHVMKPNEEGFVFKKLPYSEYNRRDLIIKSLSVSDREIYINEDILQDGSVIVPTEKQKELYDIVSDFCEKLENGGFSKYNVGELIYKSNKGKIVPNTTSLFGSRLCYIKKK